MGSRYYDRKGQPIEDTLQWANLLKDNEYRVVEQTTLLDGTLISTVWLGVDYGFGEGPPVFFETMVFPKVGSGDCRRYSTEEEARAGHAEMVEEWKKGSQ